MRPVGQVADFGISRVKDPTKSYLSATNNNGTPMYMAPEQFNGTHLDEKVRYRRPSAGSITPKQDCESHVAHIQPSILFTGINVLLYLQCHQHKHP